MTPAGARRAAVVVGVSAVVLLAAACRTAPAGAASPVTVTAPSVSRVPVAGPTPTPCVNPVSAADAAQLYSGVTTAVRATVTDDRSPSDIAWGAVEDPTPTTEVVLHDVEVLWGDGPPPLLLFDAAPVGAEIPDGEYVLVLMPFAPERGLYQLGMGSFGAFSVDDDGGLASHCIDHSDPGWHHVAPGTITADELVADLTGAFGEHPTPPPGLEPVSG